MKKNVLDVGNCSIDHAAIQRLIEDRFEASVHRAVDSDEAWRMLRAQRFDLVLVNRRLHGDYSEGIELIRQMKEEPDLAAVPAMLVSDLPTYQETAVGLGAEPGFGKSELTAAETRRRLERVLGSAQGVDPPE